MPAEKQKDRLLEDDLQRFFSYLQSERCYSVHTVSAYRRD
ncbi:MAG: site-specific integrase, partial [Gammaproteobacteria bacterium]|nr:site-specific integrase [Gammaproteobacteria bacterium]